MNDITKNLKYAIVTGGSKGIGKAIVSYLLNNNYHVAFSYRNEEDALNLMNQHADKCDRLLPIRANMAIREECESFIYESGKEFERIDLLVNNVGVAKDSLLVAASDNHIYETINTNLLSYIFCSREVLKFMLPQRQGNIINISSISAFHPNKGQSIYAATKGAIDALTKALAVEMASKNIRVNAIAPGIICTSMVEKLLETHKNIINNRVLLKKAGDVENITSCVRFLLENDYITGEVININGGLSLT